MVPAFSFAILVDARMLFMQSELLQRITFEADKCGGRPCIRGKRIRVVDILQLLSAGAPFEEILTDYRFWSGKTSSPRLNMRRCKPTISCCNPREVSGGQSAAAGFSATPGFQGT
jgi:hypothetical protein